MKAHYTNIGIVNMIREGLKDIKLQRWLSRTLEKMLTKATINENLPDIQIDRQL